MEAVPTQHRVMPAPVPPKPTTPTPRKKLVEAAKAYAAAMKAVDDARDGLNRAETRLRKAALVASHPPVRKRSTPKVTPDGTPSPF
jgi:hypothetical protein